MAFDFGSAIGGLFSGIGSIFKGSSDQKINEQNIALQRETNAQNERLWREEFEEAKKQYFNTLKYNSEEAQKAFEREVNWNNPVNQMAMLRTAGINPFSVFGQNGNIASVHSSSSSGTPGSLPSPPNLVSPQASFQNSGLSATLQMVDAVANVVDKVSSSSLRGSQKREIDTLLVDNLKKLQAETENEKAKAALNNLAVEFEQTFGYAMRDQNLKNVVADYEKIISEVAVNIANGEYIDEKKVTEQTQQELNRILKKKHGSERELLQKQVNAFDSRLRQEISESNSRIQSNLASAEESRMSAKRMRDLTPHEVNKLSYEALEALENYFGKSLDNEQKAKVLPLVEESIKLHVRQQGADYWNPFRYVGTLLSGAGSQGIKEFFK